MCFLTIDEFIPLRFRSIMLFLQSICASSDGHIITRLFETPFQLSLNAMLKILFPYVICAATGYTLPEEPTSYDHSQLEGAVVLSKRQTDEKDKSTEQFQCVSDLPTSTCSFIVGPL